MFLSENLALRKFIVDFLSLNINVQLLNVVQGFEIRVIDTRSSAFKTMLNIVKLSSWTGVFDGL